MVINDRFFSSHECCLLGTLSLIDWVEQDRREGGREGEKRGEIEREDRSRETDRSRCNYSERAEGKGEGLSYWGDRDENMGLLIVAFKWVRYCSIQYSNRSTG